MACQQPDALPLGPVAGFQLRAKSLRRFPLGNRVLARCFLRERRSVRVEFAGAVREWERYQRGQACLDSSRDGSARAQSVPCEQVKARFSGHHGLRGRHRSRVRRAREVRDERLQATASLTTSGGRLQLHPECV